MSLAEYAKEELKLANFDKEDTEFVLDLIKKFAEYGHSGTSAPYFIHVFSRLASFKPIAPLTGEDSEWIDVTDQMERGMSVYQNKRCPIIFKEGESAYNIEGKVFHDSSGYWTNRDSKVSIEFPYVVPDEPEIVEREDV
jgi:hypothetical protein